MTSKAINAFLVLAATSAIATNMVFAQTYQWKDSSGKTVISDTPPPANAANRRSIGTSQPSVISEKPTEKAADAPKTTAEKDLDFKKRQQENKEKAEKQAKEQAAEADRAENCERAKKNLAILENNQPVAVGGYDSGQPRYVDTQQRQQELERTRRIIAESCK